MKLGTLRPLEAGLAWCGVRPEMHDIVSMYSVKNYLYMYLNDAYQFSEQLGGFQPLMIGFIGFMESISVHRVELHPR